VKISLS